MVPTMADKPISVHISGRDRPVLGALVNGSKFLAPARFSMWFLATLKDELAPSIVVQPLLPLGRR